VSKGKGAGKFRRGLFSRGDSRTGNVLPLATGSVAKEKRRVVILLPTGDTVHRDFAISLAHLMKHTLLAMPTNLVDLKIQGVSMSILPAARHVLAQYALDNNFTHALFIDSDMEFPCDAILHFLTKSDPILGVNAVARREPWPTTARYADGGYVQTTIDSSGTESVSRIGFGLVWVATEVFRKIEPPWFNFTWQEDYKRYEGEDHYFCRKAIDAGFDVKVDHDISKYVRHMGSFAFSPLVKAMLSED